MQTIWLASVTVTTQNTEPSTADCVELLRSLQQLTRARRRATRTRPDAGALMMLSALDGTTGMRISVLAEILMIDISAASRQVASLQTAGLIGRIRDEADHRAQLVRLTPAGESELAVACNSAGSEIAGRISDWAESDVLLLTGLVRKLADDLVASEPGCAKTHPASPRSLAVAGP
jgi:DNA-binding MarR family transcriptional regulator